MKVRRQVTLPADFPCAEPGPEPAVNTLSIGFA
jgi:hypothetical protein